MKSEIYFRIRIAMMLPSALTGRLASRYSATGQTNRQQYEPKRPGTQRAF
ncbi:MAG TPA: hypothetical protein VGY56_09400 [Verrucomicrobiae bacterium]|nr:hypothetical protein [Verrucomicrobiae bacterium]